MEDVLNTKRKDSKKIGLFLSSEAGKAIIAFVIVMMIGILFNSDGVFFQIGTHRDAMRQMSIFGILAVGMTIVIISGGIDLSVGSVLAVSAVTFSIFSIHLQWPAYIVIPLVILIGTFCGLIMGSLIAYLKLQPFIATLAMMVFARGLARLITGGRKISAYITLKDGSVESLPMPKIFSLLDRRVMAGNMNVVTIIFFIVFVVSWVLLAKHKWGREIYSIGGNEESARLSGVPVRFTKVIAYMYSSGLAAVGGILQAAQETQGNPLAGNSYELTAIAMAVIGGTSLSGGRGSMVTTFLGILVMGYLEKILSINAVPEAGRQMITGLIIILAVLAQSVKRR